MKISISSSVRYSACGLVTMSLAACVPQDSPSRANAADEVSYLRHAKPDEIPQKQPRLSSASTSMSVGTARTGIYLLSNQCAAQNLSIKDASTALGAVAQLGGAATSDATRFFLESYGGGKFSIKPLHASLAYSLGSVTGLVGSQVRQTSPQDTDDQRWRFEQSGTGFFRIYRGDTRLVLTGSDNGIVTLENPRDSCTQLWSLKAAVEAKSGGFEAVAYSGMSVLLQWTAVSGAVEYELLRNDQRLILAEDTQRRFRDAFGTSASALSPGQNLTYRLRALDANGVLLSQRSIAIRLPNGPARLSTADLPPQGAPRSRAYSKFHGPVPTRAGTNARNGATMRIGHSDRTTRSIRLGIHPSMSTSRAAPDAPTAMSMATISAPPICTRRPGPCRSDMSTSSCRPPIRPSSAMRIMSATRSLCSTESGRS